ncbi:toprim domain-containing protein [Acetobacteraceae bacterium]|nr:toprim domain-containing protein [Candidatus Parcubacteria bacterium]
MDTATDQIKAKLSINEVVGQYLQLKKAGRNYTARCPFHNERTPSFMVSTERGSYICFGCGKKGDIFSFVQEIEGVDFPAALRELAQKAGVKLERTFTREKKDVEHDERLREVCEEATKFFELKLKENSAVQKYLETRGVHTDTVSSWRLGYAPADWRQLSEYLLSKGFTKDEVFDAGLIIKSEKKIGEVYDRFRGRIMFPIADSGGNIIAFSGRFFEDIKRREAKTSNDTGSSPDASQSEAFREPAKYVNSPETALFKKSRTLYGFDRAKQYIRKLDCVLLVEGQFDLIMSHQTGLPFAVALSGTALTPEHLSLLGRLSKRLVLALDADEAGIRSGLRSSIMALQSGFDVKIPTFPHGEDPADVARENPELLKAAIRTSTTAIEFFLEALRPQAKDERGYKKLVEVQVLPLIRAISSQIEQEHFVRIVAQKIGVSEGAVRAELSKNLAPTLAQGIENVQESVSQPVFLPLERKVGMLLAHFGRESEVGKRLLELVSEVRMKEIETTLAPHQELLRFKFESEIGEESNDEAKVVGDMLGDIERMVTKEKMGSAGEDTKQIQDLARRTQELRQ